MSAVPPRPISVSAGLMKTPSRADAMTANQSGGTGMPNGRALKALPRYLSQRTGRTIIRQTAQRFRHEGKIGRLAHRKHHLKLEDVLRHRRLIAGEARV